MFDDAKKVVTAAPKKKGKTVPEKAITGIHDLAVINAAIVRLEALKGLAESLVKNNMREAFINEGIQLQRRPENFKGVEEEATASCQLKSRATNKPLSESEIEEFRKANLPVETYIAKVDTYVIDPKYVKNAALLTKVAEALTGVEGIPTDLFLKQDKEEVTIVPESALDQLFTLDEKLVRALIDKVFNYSVTTKLPVEVEPLGALNTSLQNIFPRTSDNTQ